MLKVGDKIPEFALDGSHATHLSDKDLIGKYAVIIFYPANNTGG